jgi:Pyruvate/2-oxoacid:ferredoxin oxidoreductase delta subunit
MLESMASKGLLFRTNRHGQVSYSAFQYIFGLYDFQVNTVDRELAELMEEYFPHLGVIKSQFRVVPVNSAVDATPGIATYDQIRDLVKRQKIISVTPCICRKEQGLLGRECDRPSETCSSFGIAAEYQIETDIGRRIDVDEALGILDLAEESNLVLCPTNSEDIAFICCCCGCCCGMLRVLKLADRPADQIRSSFRAAIDADRCNGCAICLDPCQMDAIVAALLSDIAARRAVG